MKLRPAKELTEERKREADLVDQKRFESARQRAIEEIEKAHSSKKRTAQVFDVPESVDALLRAAGYVVEVVKIRPEDATPGTCRTINVSWE